MTTTINAMSITERITAPTPKFFKRVRLYAGILGAIGLALVTAPVSLPAGIIAIGGYMVTAGAVGAAVATTTVDQSELDLQEAANRRSR